MILVVLTMAIRMLQTSVDEAMETKFMERKLWIKGGMHYHTHSF
ncbi:hypothetical protein SLEP1_g49165 [Rubroshorea leprosula]|uniref:Uncharacterized protein n=1 Tax=Rubroshorea leprosula TaxID=152421 RepID=A0AAV5LW52_9ROSI|nr:hypothetical protein SLEP1_g49165 [Rubroshorea leprosula]